MPIKNLSDLAKIMPLILLIIGVPAAIFMGLEVAKKQDQQIIKAPSWRFTKQNVHLSHDKLGSFLHYDHGYVTIKDPFLPKITVKTTKLKKPEPIQLDLSMIVINYRHKVCKINGRLYLEGENGPKFKVKRIYDNKVLVDISGEKRWLFLNREM